ncbi:LOW QUALITY PROTEIN: hypothetical protein QTO34_013992 [Cnephaeus nilssonii]|uniref:DUF4371 domain-containing protein n=1 Tax=Cnephaeus nilssonii TaxID=3371016 RepID=A0AA40I9E2_CNENI|nr:LOW QUALITY PROTEIN: hypothetical protein QTO34_013992 [Eptesicus nilssonii]
MAPGTPGSGGMGPATGHRHLDLLNGGYATRSPAPSLLPAQSPSESLRRCGGFRKALRRSRQAARSPALAFDRGGPVRLAVRRRPRPSESLRRCGGFRKALRRSRQAARSPALAFDRGGPVRLAVRRRPRPSESLRRCGGFRKALRRSRQAARSPALAFDRGGPVRLAVRRRPRPSESLRRCGGFRKALRRSRQAARSPALAFDRGGPVRLAVRRRPRPSESLRRCGGFRKALRRSRQAARSPALAFDRGGPVRLAVRRRPRPSESLRRCGGFRKALRRSRQAARSPALAFDRGGPVRLAVRRRPRPSESLRRCGGFRKALRRSRQAARSPALAFDRGGPVRLAAPQAFRKPPAAMVQTLSSRRQRRRELSVLLAQSATPATLSPAPCASCWPNRGRSGVMRRMLRKYSEDFLQYGFTSIITAGIEKPQCVICCEVLSAKSMKLNKLKRHFDSKHPSFAGKDTNYFRSKADGLKKARLDTGGKYHKQNVAAIEASYLNRQSYETSHIAEDLLLPAAKDIVRVMIGEEFVIKLSAISLSNDTVCRRIDDMSADILNQVIQEIKPAPLPIFSIQLDESTNIANRFTYINDGDFKDEFLFCKPLEMTTTARDVFDTVGSFLKEHKISWEKVCGVCTDGAPAMLGFQSGFQHLVLNESPKVIGTHCMIHWQILATKMLPQELQEVMKRVISSVNFVKASTLNRRWSSRGKVLKRVFELCDEHKTFFKQKARPQFKALFSDKSELQKIAYLVDIFAILNELNLSLQGPNATCLDLSEKIRSLQMKLQLWQKKKKKKNWMKIKFTCCLPYLLSLRNMTLNQTKGLR